MADLTSDRKPGGLKGWLIDLAASLLEDLRVQAVIRKLIRQTIVEDVMPLLPVIAGAAATSAMNAAVQKWPGIENAVETAVEVGQVVDETRTGLNDLIPDIDFGIEALDRVLDVWRPK